MEINIRRSRRTLQVALVDYNTIIEKENTPENLYNQALAYFLQYDLEKGCVDIEESAATGYEPAEKRRIDSCTERYLCSIPIHSFEILYLTWWQQLKYCYQF